MRCACIDIGSNTTRLLVAECGGDGSEAIRASSIPGDGPLRQIAAQRSFTRLGHGRGSDGSISAERIAAVVDAVVSQVGQARALGADPIRAVATAAVRDAPNGAELQARIAEAAGLQVVILSAEQEARLAFAGAAAMLGPAVSEHRLGVVDVGGGSTELVVGPPVGEPTWWESLSLGSANLTERHLAGDPPRASEIAALRAEVDGALGSLRPPPLDRAVAVGGSATTLHRLMGGSLGDEHLQATLERLMGAPASEQASAYGMDHARARLLPAGIVLLQGVGRVLGTTLECGRGGLREGVILAERGAATFSDPARPGAAIR